MKQDADHEQCGRNTKMDYMSGSAPTFKGLPLPEGVDRHNLYASAFRVVSTYAMPLADLDNELKAIFEKKACTIKFDDRRNFVGKRECSP